MGQWASVQVHVYSGFSLGLKKFSESPEVPLYV